MMLLRGDDGCGLIIGGVVALASFIGWMGRARGRTREQFLARIGAKWNGRVVEGSFFEYPRLEMEVEGVEGQLTYHPGSPRKTAWTKIQFNSPAPHRLRLHPEGFTSFMHSIFGGTDVVVGNAEFDAAFWIEASDPAWARTVLTPRIRRQLGELRATGSWFSSNDVSLDLGPSGMVLKVSGNLVDDESYLVSFVDLAVLILSEIRGAGVVVAEVEVKSGSECPVCGHGVDKAAKRCPKCSTPHHKECWKYMGGCAIFACEGRVHS